MAVDSSKRSVFVRIRDRRRIYDTDGANSRKFHEINRYSSQRVRKDEQPVLFFNASTRLTRTSLNAAFAWLAANSLQSTGVPVVFMTCMRGLNPCLLATDRENPKKELPCQSCIRLSKSMYNGLQTVPLEFHEDPILFNEVEGLTYHELESYVHEGVPLGELTLPSLRWIMRRHHLEDVPNALPLQRLYIRSAWSTYLLAKEWISNNHPRAIVVFNGLQYPEATVKWIGKQNGIPTFTHEIGLMPETAFFTEGEATACPINLPADLEMTPERNKKLDDYLESRMKGSFQTAGVRFWPEMEGLTPEFWKMVRMFRQVVPVFTNVVFDTSQKHANVVFDNMFEWLDSIKSLIEKNADTLFVIRAHPDELRPGKESLETVTDWVVGNHLTHLTNVLYIAPDQYFSSYDLIRIAKFVMVYNSTIGLEAAAMGAAVLSGGKSRYTQVPITYFPQSKEDFIQKAQEMLDADEWVVPDEFQQNARKFMYYQFFHTALDFSEFLSPDPVWNGYVKLKDFKPESLLPENNETMRVIQDGILRGKPFVYPHSFEKDPQLINSSVQMKNDK
jgi:hypothetical protein